MDNINSLRNHSGESAMPGHSNLSYISTKFETKSVRLQIKITRTVISILVFFTVLCLVGQVFSQVRGPFYLLSDRRFTSDDMLDLMHIIEKEKVSRIPLIKNVHNPVSVSWQLDSLAIYDEWGIIERRINSFDVNGYLLTELIDFGLQNSERYTYTYDSDGNRLTSLVEKWDNNTWKEFERSTATYENNKLLTYFTEIFWNANTWENDRKFTYAYDINGNKVVELSEEWEKTVWVNLQRITYSYDSNGNKVSSLTEVWVNNEWSNSFRRVYTYDVNGRNLTELREQWQNNAWVSLSRYTYTYNMNGDLITRLLESWQNDAWINSLKYTYAYGTNVYPESYLCEKWQNGTWFNSYRYSYTFDVNGNMLTSINEVWQNNVWMNKYRSTYTYDVNGNSNTGKTEIWGSGYWQSYIGSLYIYSQQGDVTDRSISGYRYDAHFLSFTNYGIGNVINDESVTVYPNPTVSNINIEVSKLNKHSHFTVLSPNGLELLHEPITKNVTSINISSLPRGIYLVKIIGDRTVRVVKIVKE